MITELNATIVFRNACKIPVTVLFWTMRFALWVFCNFLLLLHKIPRNCLKRHSSNCKCETLEPQKSWKWLLMHHLTFCKYDASSILHEFHSEWINVQSQAELGIGHIWLNRCVCNIANLLLNQYLQVILSTCIKDRGFNSPPSFGNILFSFSSSPSPPTFMLCLAF